MLSVSSSHIIYTDGDNGYMAFGISGETTRSAMGGSDVMVVYLDNGTPKIQDYSINEYSLVSIKIVISINTQCWYVITCKHICRPIVVLYVMYIYVSAELTKIIS